MDKLVESIHGEGHGFQLSLLQSFFCGSIVIKIIHISSCFLMLKLRSPGLICRNAGY